MMTPEKKRITFCVLSFLVAFFPLSAMAEESPPPVESIVCPKFAAAEQGSLLDEYYLAKAYDKGYCGIPLDKKSAEAWYLKAATQGHMLAQHELGEIYFSGENGATDYPSAKKWYLAAALQEYGPSQLRLGFLYAEAHFKGLSVDYAEAEKWFLKAAEQNASDARFRLGNFYHNYKNPPDMEKALLWLTKAAEGGHRVAMFDLARMLQNQNPEQSLMWMTKAAELDLLSAQETLSKIYATGNGAPKDPAKSFIWTMKIASKPAAPAVWLNKAGDILSEGWETVPKNPTQAAEFYERAAAKGDAHAKARLKQMKQGTSHDLVPQE